MAAVKEFVSGNPAVVVPLNSPFTRIEAVTPSDSNELGYVSRALHVTTTAGTIAVVTEDGHAGTVYLPLGGVLDIAVKQVKSTGTTAAGIVALR